MNEVHAMMNADMLGRLDPEQVSVFDAKRNGEPNQFHDKHDISGLNIKRIDHNIAEFVQRSDQGPFYLKNIEVIFFFEGFTPDGEMNPDYHGLDDEPDKIEYGKLFDITRLAYRHLVARANK